MSRFTDYYMDGEVKDIMERLLERFPTMFEGLDPENIAFVTTKKKRSAKAMRLISVSYPMEAFLNKPYIVEIYESRWKPLTPKQKNLSVFSVLCAIPQGGTNASAKHYGKKVKPEISMSLREFAAAGGVPNWMENPAAVDPMETTEEKMAEVVPNIDGTETDGDGIGDVTRVAGTTGAAKSTPKAPKTPKTT